MVYSRIDTVWNLVDAMPAPRCGEVRTELILH